MTDAKRRKAVAVVQQERMSLFIVTQERSLTAAESRRKKTLDARLERLAPRPIKSAMRALESMVRKHEKLAADVGATLAEFGVAK